MRLSIHPCLFCHCTSRDKDRLHGQQTESKADTVRLRPYRRFADIQIGAEYLQISFNLDE